MKKRLWLLLALVIGVTMWAAPAFAQETAAIYVNGQYLRTDTRPFLADGTTFVPLRTVSAALGAEVNWQDNRAQIVLGDKSITLEPNSKNAVVNGKNTHMAEAPRLQGGRILVPLRFVSEQLAAKVDYTCRAYAMHIVDITTADGAELPVNSGYVGAAEDDRYIYLADEGVYKIDKQTGEQTKLDVGNIYPYKICLADGCLYYSRSNATGTNVEGHKLYRYDLASGEETPLLNGAYRPYRYGDWLYYLTAPNYESTLCRVRLVDGTPQGEPEKLANNVYGYWLMNDTLTYNMWGFKYFTAALDGSSSQKLVLPDDFTRQAYDAGWFYGMGRTYETQQKLYRYRAGETPYCLENFAMADINGKPLNNVDIYDIKVYGNIMYFTISGMAEYIPNHSGSVSGALYARKVDGGNAWQLTKEKVLDYYVLRDKILYRTQVFDAQGNAQYPWRVIANDLHDVYE